MTHYNNKQQQGMTLLHGGNIGGGLYSGNGSVYVATLATSNTPWLPALSAYQLNTEFPVPPPVAAVICGFGSPKQIGAGEDATGGFAKSSTVTTTSIGES